MVHCGEKLSESTKDVGSADEDFGMGRSKHVSVGDLFKCGGTGGSYLWVGYVGDDPLVWSPAALITSLVRSRRSVSPIPVGCTPGLLSSATRRQAISAQ